MSKLNRKKKERKRKEKNNNNQTNKKQQQQKNTHGLAPNRLYLETTTTTEKGLNQINTSANINDDPFSLPQFESGIGIGTLYTLVTFAQCLRNKPN